MRKVVMSDVLRLFMYKLEMRAKGWPIVDTHGCINCGQEIPVDMKICWDCEEGE